jgi:hypothetical protein
MVLLALVLSLSHFQLVDQLLSLLEVNRIAKELIRVEAVDKLQEDTTNY